MPMHFQTERLPHFLQSHLTSSGIQHKGHIHSNIMMVAWLLISNIGLWCLFFKYSRIYTHFHAFFMSVTVIMTVISAFMVYIQYGIHSMSGLHIALGIFVSFLVMITAGSGQMAHGMRIEPHNSTKFVVFINKFHRILGWIIFLSAWIQLLSTFIKSKKRGLFALAFIVNFFSYSLFLLFKFKFKKRSQQVIFDKDHIKSNHELRQIKYEKQLAYLNKDYFIFENKVYQLDPVLSCHPGGWQAIKAIKGREVDRYIYGTQPLEISVDSEMTVTNHYGQSIHLASAPIGVLYNPCPYPSMSISNPCSIQQLLKQYQSPSLYTVYLQSKMTSFDFKGYTEQSQLGKYWALQIKKKLVRLYSCVNFLNIRNLKLMTQIIGKNGNSHLHERIRKLKKVIYYEGKVREVQIKEFPNQDKLIPICIKKYDQGEFTKQFLSGNFTSEVQISMPRGRGLKLHELASTQKPIFIFAAGTGHYPFCDLIDLLYKKSLVTNMHPSSIEIIKQSPIIQNSLILKKLSINLYISVQSLQQIHPITLLQCNHLSSLSTHRLHTYLLLKNVSSQDTKRLQQMPFIERTNQRFQNVVKSLIGQEYHEKQRKGYGFQIAYICGPPRFSKALVQEFQAGKVSTEKYLVL